MTHPSQPLDTESLPQTLAGRTYLVTGVSREAGIGAGIARRLAAQGANLFLASWSPADIVQELTPEPEFADGLVAELRAAGHRVAHLALDLADAEAPAALVKAAVAEFGHLDGVVANHARSSEYSLTNVTAAELDVTFAINTRASILLTQEFAAQHDDTRPGGRVIYFTSGQALGGMPDELPYIVSKGAIQQMTQSISQTLARRGITVNCVNPGPTDTGWADETTDAVVERRMPQGRWGLADDAARLVAWLLSDDAQWIVGQTINSEGGFYR